MRFIQKLLIAAQFSSIFLLSAKIDFNREIRPILSEHCFACHGLDDPQGGLRLDFAEFAYKGGK